VAQVRFQLQPLVTDARMFASNTSHLALPKDFARYMAVSASRRNSSGCWYPGYSARC
jgi:hypothetical protein